MSTHYTFMVFEIKIEERTKPTDLLIDNEQKAFTKLKEPFLVNYILF